MAGVALGFTSSYLPSLRYAQTYYIQLNSKFYDLFGLTNAFESMRKTVYNKIAWLAFFAGLFV